MKVPGKECINRTINNQASPEEAKEVIRWFSTPEGNEYLSHLMDENAKSIVPGTEATLIDHPIPSQEMYNYISNRINWQKRRRWLIRVAAVLIPAILFIGQFMYINNWVNLFDGQEYEEVFVPKGERMQIIFQDGTKVTLNSESRMRYPRKFAFSERIVELDGEAFFEVATNKNRPFKVNMNEVDVKVLGTLFNAKAYSEDTEIHISLETGSVSLNADSRLLAKLKPGEKAIYDKKTGTCKVIRQQQIVQNSAWKRNLIIFEHTPLSEVITVLERYYNIKFEIKDPDALNYSYTITTQKDQLYQLLFELEKITPVRFLEKDRLIEVTLKK
jgi:ferric-dicitrate binding protein FerR (iron transport regulator)